jgi:fructokinase
VLLIANYEGELGAAFMDVITCGELIIDFVSLESGATLAQSATFKKAPGGAPANVVVGLARLGKSTGFMGQVGDDEFGHFMADTLRTDGVDVHGLHFSTQERTALSFVSLLANGERDFMFYRHPSADMTWQICDEDAAILTSARIFHYGSISLINEPSRSSTLTALRYAKESGALISYDPNLRLSLWPSVEAARTGILDAWHYANVIKVSEEELTFLSGEATPERGARSLWSENLQLLIVTQGSAGCSYYTAAGSGHLPGFTVQAVDTTGAGDGFVAGTLAGLLDAELRLDKQAIENALRLGNAVGALATTQRGAISSLPSRDEVQAFLSQHPA